MSKVLRVVSKTVGKAAVAELQGAMQQQLEGKTPALLVCFASMQQPLAELMPALSEAFPKVPLVGSSTAGEFTDEGELGSSAVLFALVGDFVAHVAMAEGLREDVDGVATKAAGALPPRAEGYAHRTAILLFDGLVGVGEEATLTCASLLGEDVRFAGAAAGDDWAIKSSWVGAGGHAAVNALALAVIDSRAKLGIGVVHGHTTMGERVKVTRATGSVVHELDGVPAWRRYTEITRKHSVPAWGVDPDDITDSGRRLQYFAWYQTGIDVGGAFKNRTPLAKLDDGSLAYACGIPEGTELELLASDEGRQIESARAAAEQALKDLGARPSGALVFECGCRKVYLGDGFAKAPMAVAKTLGGVPLAGFEAYGEVALNVGDFSGFHNATTVVLAFPEQEA